MTIVDWRQAGGAPMTEGFVAENLNLNDEYILELVETSYRENVTQVFKGEPQTNDIFTTIWQVEGHKTKVWLRFNLPIGYLTGKEGPNERSNVVKFAKRFRAVPKDQPFRLADHFTDHMRIRAYLKKQEKSDYYNVDLDTLGPFDAVRKPADDTETILLKKALSLQPNQGEAYKLYKELMPSGDEAKFLIIWNMVMAEKGIINGDTGKKL